MDRVDQAIAALTAQEPRPTLYQRACEAAWARKDAEAAAEAEEIANLRDEAIEMMEKVLGLTEDERDEALRSMRHASHNTERMKVEFDFDRWHFRVRYAIEPIKIGRSDSSQEVIGYDYTPVYEHRPKQASQWSEFKELADIVSGMGIGVRPRA